MKELIVSGIVILTIIGIGFALWIHHGNTSSGNMGWAKGYSIGFIKISPNHTSNDIVAALRSAGFKYDPSRSFAQALPGNAQVKKQYRHMKLFTTESNIDGFSFILGLSQDPRFIYYCETHSGTNIDVSRMVQEKVKLINIIKTKIEKHKPNQAVHRTAYRSQ